VSDEDKSTAQFETQFLAAAQYAYKRYQTMTGPRFGVRWMRNYFLSNEGFQDDGYLGKQGPLASMLPELRDFSSDEHPFTGYKFVRQVDTMLIEPPTPCGHVG
jgi:D-amino-acid oxidase